MELPDPDSLVDEQIAYYRARAPEYDDWWLRTGRYDQDDEFAHRWEAEKSALTDALVAFDPRGDVLELAAGTGNLTAQLARHADRLTALDASAEALEIARHKLAAAEGVDFVVGDVFAWEPERRFDAVVFGFWLSHVPPGRLGQFWGLVGRALKADGRVFFTDNAVPVELAASQGGRRPQIGADGVTTPWSATWLDVCVSIRELADGRRFHIVKRAWTPDQLEAELHELGWEASVRSTGSLFIYGMAQPVSGP